MVCPQSAAGLPGFSIKVRSVRSGWRLSLDTVFISGGQESLGRWVSVATAGW
jgi:hypothetical protein